MVSNLSTINNLPSTSTEALYVWVLSYADPTGAPITYAIIPAAQTEPALGDYQAGSWITDPVTPNTPPVAGTTTVVPQQGRYLAALPQGQGSSFPLAPGSHYEVFVRLGLDGSVHRAGVVRTL